MEKLRMPKQNRILLHWSLKPHPRQAGYVFCDHAAFHPFFKRIQQTYPLPPLATDWRLGQRYRDWRLFYFTTPAFHRFQQCAIALEGELRPPVTDAAIEKAALALNQQITLFEKRIQEERPAWRFKWGGWPIKTKGWPFNRDAHRFAESLLEEFTITSAKVMRVLLNTRGRHQRQTLDSLTRPTVALPTVTPSLTRPVNIAPPFLQKANGLKGIRPTLSRRGEHDHPLPTHHVTNSQLKAERRFRGRSLT
jgi:hypothetical protein